MEILAYSIPIVLFILGRKYKESKILKFIILLYMWALMGLNTYTPDYAEYSRIYRYSTTWTVDVNIEIGYRLICSLFYTLGLTYAQFRMVWAGIYVLIISRAINRYPVHCNVVLSLFVIWPFITYVSGIRFAMANAIVLYAVPFLLEKGKKGIVKYIALVAFAMTVHTSVVFYLIFLLSKRRYTTSQYLKIFAVIVAVSVVLRFSLLDGIINRFFSGTIAHKLEKWISYKADTGIVHMNMIGFIANILFIIAYAFLIFQMSIPIKRGIRSNVEEQCGYSSDGFSEKTIDLFQNISALLLLIIPGFIITAEYTRIITGVLFIYYGVYDRYRYGINDTSRSNRISYSFLFIAVTVLYILFMRFAGQGYDFISTFKDNILFGTVV